MEINYDSKVWFSPRNVLYYYDKRLSEIGDKFFLPKHKVIHEARSVALFLTALMKIQNREFWLQMVDSRLESTPDIRTVCYDKRKGDFNFFCYQDVEVVTFEKHSSDSVISFLERTKLVKERKYSPDTTILCHLNKTFQSESWKEIHEALSRYDDIQNDIFLLARTAKGKQEFQIARVHPELDTLGVVDVLKVSQEKDLRGVITLKRGKATEKLFNRNGKEYVPF